MGMRTGRASILLLLGFWWIASIACAGASPVLLPTPQATASPLPTMALMSFVPLPLATPSLPAEGEGYRVCTAADFFLHQVSFEEGDWDSLIGYRPPRGWNPGNGWEHEIGLCNTTHAQVLTGYRREDQYLFITEQVVCRYAGGRYGLGEITDYLLLPPLQRDQVLIGTIVSWLPPGIKERYRCQMERCITTTCEREFGYVLVVAEYDEETLPVEIPSGFTLSVAPVAGWQWDTQAGHFEPLRIDDLQCWIEFH